MKFKYIGDQPRRMYGDNLMQKGDVIELDGPIADKAGRCELLETVKCRKVKNESPNTVASDSQIAAG